jgi:prephenate dehydrogenase
MFTITAYLNNGFVYGRIKYLSPFKLTKFLRLFMMISTIANPFVTDCPYQTIIIVGLGLIGGSFMLAMRERYPNTTLVGVDANAETVQQALKNRWVNQAFLQLADVPLETLASSLNTQQLIMLASHLTINEALLEAIAPRIQVLPSVTVVDLGSCKRKITTMGQLLLPQQFVGGHPIAGREKGGLANASALLFFGKRFLLTPHEGLIGSDTLQRLEQLLKAIGMNPVYMSAEEHDRTMAFMSHLPQLYAVLLTNLISRYEPGKLLGNHGGGIDDQLRIAASPYEMWGDVFAENADNMREVLAEMVAMLQELHQQLDTPELADWFAISNQIHAAFHQLKQPQKTTII